MSDYKQVALDRFYDAFALYQAERYSASFYLAGYVIEIGVKHKFVELGNTEAGKMSLNVISYLLTGTKKTKIPNFKEVANIASKFNEKESQDWSHLKMVTLQRAPKGPDDRFHNTGAFIEGLFHWYEVFVHQDTGDLRKFIYKGEFRDFYKVFGSGEPTSAWSTDLRYEPSDKGDKSAARIHLVLCLIFLQKILKYRNEDINEYEKVVKLLEIVNSDNKVSQDQNLQNTIQGD